MGNRATPSRSFNTVKHSNRKERQARQERERMTLLSICIVIIAILLTLSVFLFCSLADELNDKNSGSDDNETETNNNPAQQGITYTQITLANSKVHEGELIVVNESHAYVFPTIPTGLVNIYENRTKVNGTNPYQISYTTYQLQKSAFDAFERMLLKYYEVSEDNSTIITSSYRSYEDQQNLGSSIAEGYSDHHTGYCVALQKSSFSASGNREKLENDHWIYQNGYKYGYIVRYPANKTDATGVSDYTYCFRFVGIPHATYINQKGICLEEYVELLKSSYSANEHLKIEGADGNSYEVYYVAASNGDLTTVSVPSNYTYTVSGDNIGGFIITVNLSAPNA